MGISGYGCKSAVPSYTEYYSEYATGARSKASTVNTDDTIYD